MVFNAQHDCERGGCIADATRPTVQEREWTEVLVSVVQHADNQHFIINMHALHNTYILQSFVPPDLYSLDPLAANQAHRKRRRNQRYAFVDSLQYAFTNRTAARKKAVHHCLATQQSTSRFRCSRPNIYVTRTAAHRPIALSLPIRTSRTYP